MYLTTSSLQLLFCRTQLSHQLSYILSYLRFIYITERQSHTITETFVSHITQPLVFTTYCRINWLCSQHTANLFHLIIVFCYIWQDIEKQHRILPRDDIHQPVFCDRCDPGDTARQILSPLHLQTSLGCQNLL